MDSNVIGKQNNLDKAIEYLQQSGSITGEEISNICVLAADALREVQRCRGYIHDYEAEHSTGQWVIPTDKPWHTPLDQRLDELFGEQE